MSEQPLAGRVAAVRRFNRFYTQQIGVLQEHLLRSEFSLTEVRVLYEIAHTPEITATSLARTLGIDGGYLSRIVQRFERRGLIRRIASTSDARQSHLVLTPKGSRTLAPLEAASDAEVSALLNKLSEGKQQQLLRAMQTIEQIIAPEKPQATAYVLRSHQPGDIGWVIHRHGALYAQEYNWNEEFEAHVAEIAAQFIRAFNPQKERCWIAERDGERVGCVFLVRDTDEVARLRLLLVEPYARGMGLGRRLVHEAIEFAKRSGYRRLVLWTNKGLDAARHLYEEAGFKLVRENPHHSYGHDLIGQDWELDLRTS